MPNRTYLGWVFKNTRTERRQDSAEAAEPALGPWRGAIGVGASPDRESIANMATPVEVPKLGNTVEECLIAKWRKQKGDTVAAGEVVTEIETDKATFEVTAPVAGTLLETFFAEGTLVPVFTTLFVIGEPGESAEAFRPQSAPPPASAVPAAAAAAASPGVEIPEVETARAPRLRLLRRLPRERSARGPAGSRKSTATIRRPSPAPVRAAACSKRMCARPTTRRRGSPRPRPSASRKAPRRRPADRAWRA